MRVQPDGGFNCKRYEVELYRTLFVQGVRHDLLAEWFGLRSAGHSGRLARSVCTSRDRRYRQQALLEIRRTLLEIKRSRERLNSKRYRDRKAKRTSEVLDLRGLINTGGRKVLDLSVPGPDTLIDLRGLIG